MSECPSEEATKGTHWASLPCTSEGVSQAYRSNLAPGAQQHNDVITYSKLGSASRDYPYQRNNPFLKRSMAHSVQFSLLHSRSWSQSKRSVHVIRHCPTHTPEHQHTRTNLQLPKTSGMSDMNWRVVNIGDFLTSIGIQHTNEPHLFRHYDSNTKPDRVYYLPGQPKVVDMTSQSPTAHSQAG